MDTSPITISSPIKEKINACANPQVLQDENQSLMERKVEPKAVGNENKEEEQEEKFTRLESRIKFLEDQFYSFSKFALKFMHISAITPQLLAQDKDEAGLDMEDTRFLYKFLAEDQARVLLVGKGKEKEEKKEEGC